VIVVLRRVWLWLLVGALLSATDGAARLTYTGRQYVGRAPLAWFDATDEWTIPTWFSVSTMAAVAVGCWRQAGATRFCWRLSGSLFAYLAVDDLFGLHEMVGALVHPWLQGFGIYSWVLVMAPVFAVVGGWCAARLWRELRGQPGRRACLAAGFVALALAIGIEAAENVVSASPWRLRGLRLIDYAQWIEESFELFGPVLLLAAVWPQQASPAASGNGLTPSAARNDARSPSASRE
jgi:hypothetical protein